MPEEKGLRRGLPSGWRARALTFAALFAIMLYILATPAGLLDKADLLGYAICHRIPSHSLQVGDRALPMCARCTGTYLGSMLAVGVFILTRRRRGELPVIPVLLTLLGFTLLMGLDGANSYLSLLPGRESIYPPSNILRLLTGTLNGLMMGGILYPVAVGTFWRDYEPQPVLASFRELGLLVLGALVVVALTLTESPLILYPLALISAAGVPVMLTLVNSVMVLIATRRENQAESWRDLILPLLVGLALSLLMIGAIDVVRYGLTGTLSGLPGLGD